MKRINISQNIINIFLLIFLATVFPGCENMLNVDSKDKASIDDLNQGSIALIRNGMYSKMEDVSYAYAFDFDVRGENFISGPGSTLLDPINASLDPDYLFNLWSKAYAGIYSANNLVSLMTQLGGTNPPDIYKTYKGEALFFRALLYYNMVIRWGGVPIVLEPTYDKIQRSSEQEVWTLIKNDLTESRSLIGSFSSRLYVSDQAVKALMAKVYLATGDNANAALYADSVIVSNKFSLASTANEYSGNFTPGAGNETILALANNSSNNIHAMYSPVNDTKATWYYSPDQTLWSNLYTNSTSPVSKSGDIRKTAVFSSTIKTRCIKFPNGVSGQQLAAASTPNYDPIVLFRLSEMYLIKAEALGVTAGATVLNTYMAKRYSSAPAVSILTGLSASNYLSVILDEYHREFYGEGHWWYDVKRTNRTDLFTTLNGRNYLLYYPIPQTEIDLNGYTQNQGY